MYSPEIRASIHWSYAGCDGLTLVSNWQGARLGTLWDTINMGNFHKDGKNANGIQNQLPLARTSAVYAAPRGQGRSEIGAFQVQLLALRTFGQTTLCKQNGRFLCSPCSSFANVNNSLKIYWGFPACLRWELRFQLFNQVIPLREP